MRTCGAPFWGARCEQNQKQTKQMLSNKYHKNVLSALVYLTGPHALPPTPLPPSEPPPHFFVFCLLYVLAPAVSSSQPWLNLEFCLSFFSLILFHSFCFLPSLHQFSPQFSSAYVLECALACACACLHVPAAPRWWYVNGGAMYRFIWQCAQRVWITWTWHEWHSEQTSLLVGENDYEIIPFQPFSSPFFSWASDSSFMHDMI